MLSKRFIALFSKDKGCRVEKFFFQPPTVFKWRIHVCYADDQRRPEKEPLQRSAWNFWLILHRWFWLAWNSDQSNFFIHSPASIYNLHQRKKGWKKIELVTLVSLRKFMSCHCLTCEVSSKKKVEERIFHATFYLAMKKTRRWKVGIWNQMQ